MARTKHGLPGIYNATPISLSDEEGAALALNSAGQIIAAAPSGSSANAVQGTAADNAAAVGNPVLNGGKYFSSVQTYADGDVGDLEIDAHGNLLVAIPPQAVATNSLTLFQNLGANATLNVKATTGNIYTLICHNVGGSPAFIQIHNTATTPAGGNVPALVFPVPAGGTTTIDADFFTPNGYNLATGIAFAFSTTEATYTAGTAANQMTHVMYK